MATEPVQTYRGVLIYQETNRAHDGKRLTSHRCQVNGLRLDAQTIEALKRRIDQKPGPVG
jgi:hypothetical protein